MPTIVLNQTIAQRTPQLGEVAVGAVADYILTLGSDIEPCNLHRMLIDAMEAPVLKHMLYLNGGNQAKTATHLGMNRATLRTKLKRHNLL